MKAQIFLILICLSPFAGHSQNKSFGDLEASFFALIVEDIDTSIIWYVQNLGFEQMDKREYPDMGFKQANLKRGNSQIELIELKSAISTKDVVPNFTNKTRLQGIFKIGFSITDFDEWMDHLQSKELVAPGNIVEDPVSGKRMIIIRDPDGNRVQLFEKSY